MQLLLWIGVYIIYDTWWYASYYIWNELKCAKWLIWIVLAPIGWFSWEGLPLWAGPPKVSFLSFFSWVFPCSHWGSKVWVVTIFIQINFFMLTYSLWNVINNLQIKIILTYGWLSPIPLTFLFNPDIFAFETFYKNLIWKVWIMYIDYQKVIGKSLKAQWHINLFSFCAH